MKQQPFSPAVVHRMGLAKTTIDTLNLMSLAHGDKVNAQLVREPSELSGEFSRRKVWI
jgi:hypothetical protein